MKKRCYLCGGEVVWKSDYTFEDIGQEGVGIIHLYQCRECGVRIEAHELVEEEEWESNTADTALTSV